MNPTVSPTPRSSGRTWLIALALTLLLHVVVLVGVLLTHPFTPEAVSAQEPEPIQLVFTDPPIPPGKQDPSFFTELPEDRADQAPENPDFLSNVDSRARDEVEGGADALPHSAGESDAPHLEMVPGAPEPPDPAEEQGDAESASQPELQPERPVEDPEPGEETVATGGAFVTPQDPRPLETIPPPSNEDLLAGLLRKKGGTQAPERFQRPAGLHDLVQEALKNTGGNAELFGGVSMNTTAWNFAPWLMRFIREFVRDWNAPTAYHWGIVHGRHEIQLEIARDGALLRMDLLTQEGHDSLVQASMLSFETVAPFERLPADFPEETLILNITLNYPKVVRR